MLLGLLLLAQGDDRAVEKDVIVVVSGSDLRGGVISQVTWHAGEVLLQGAFARPDGTLAAQHLVTATGDTRVRRLDAPPPAAADAWRLKSSRNSPTGLGTITVSSDAQLPMYGVGSL